MSSVDSSATFVPRSHQEPATAEFVAKLYEVVNDSATDALISWNEGTNDFSVWNPTRFTTDVLPKYFRHSSFVEFLEQLTIYGFQLVPDRCLYRYSHHSFVPGNIHLLNEIEGPREQRRTQSLDEGSSEEGNPFDLEGAVQRFLRDKIVLGYGAGAESAAEGATEILRRGGGTVVEEASPVKSTATSKYRETKSTTVDYESRRGV